MKRIAYIFIFLTIFSGGNLYAQTFFGSLESANNPLDKDIITLDDGSYIIKEIKIDTNVPASPNSAIVLTKFNSCNNIMWCKKITLKKGVDASLNTKSLLKTTDSAIILQYVTNENFREWVVINKFNFDGELLWSKKLYFNLPLVSTLSVNDVLSMATNAGGCIIAQFCELTSVNVKERFLFLNKLNGDGSIAWSKKYSGIPLYINLSEMTYTPAMDFLMAFSGGSSINSSKLYLFKVNDLGQPEWIKKIINPILPDTYDALIVSDAEADDKGNIYYTGQTYKSVGIGYSFILKLNQTGQPLWFKYIDKEYNFNLSNIKNNNGRLILSGYKTGKDIVLSCFDSTGNELWSKVMPIISHNAQAGHIEIFKDSSLMVLFNHYHTNSALLKLNKNGYIGCGERDTSISVSPASITSVFENVSAEIGNFLVSDTTVSVEDYYNKLSIKCSSQPIPNVYLPEDTTLCFGNTLTLQAGEDNHDCSLLWSTGDTTESITVTQSGRYWLQSSYGFCQSSDTIEVIFREQLKSKLPDTVNVCPYDSFELVMPDTAVSSLYWVTPLKDASGNFITRKDKQFWAKDKGAYYLMTSLNTPCPVFDTVQLTYYELPKASAGPDTMLCFNQEYAMQGSGGVTYKWTPANYLSSDSLPDAKAMLPVTQAYKLIVRNEHGCNDTSDVLLEVRPPLKAALKASETAVCKGSKVILSASGIGGLGKEKFTFHWPQYDTTGESIIIEVTESAWHKILLSDGCSPDVEDSIFIESIPYPVAAFSIMPADPKTGQEVIFRNSSNNANRYYWFFGDGSTSTELSPSHIYRDSNMYEVQLIAEGRNGCSDTTTQKLLVISDKIVINVPNIFTPNDDGVNDIFTVNGAGIKDYTLNIYNRWGQQLLFEQTSWNGSINNQGELVPEGVYLYTIKVRDLLNRAHYLSGEVTVSY